MRDNCFYCENWSHSGFCIVKNKYMNFWEKCEEWEIRK